MRVREVASVLVLLALPVGAQDKPVEPLATEMGAVIFRAHCAVCHGRSAQGDGPMADQLRFRPADLTKLRTRNKGKFPFEDAQRIVDGRKPLKGHGGPEMPVWGDAFLESREGYSEARVREKIAQVVQYLESIQKP